MNEAVRIEKQGHVTTIILSRPEVRNAVDGPTAKALAKAFREFEADANAYVAVLWGEGGNFCAGADLHSLDNPEKRNVLSTTGDGPMGPTRMQLTKPVIAAIEGYAVAGGLELALWCDMRVASVESIFGVFCRRWGVPLIDGGSVRLPRLIGIGRAMDMILTGRAVSAGEASSWGLVNRVVSEGASRSEAEAIAHHIARFPQTCLRNDRMSAYENARLSTEEALSNEFQRGLESLSSQEMDNGVAQFVKGAGRHGVFQGTLNIG